MKPIHPMLVHFPIALLVFSVSADGAAYFTRIESLGITGWWTLLGAAISALAAVAAGLFDMYRAHRTGLSEEVHHRVHRHRLVGFALLVRSEEHTSELQSLMRISYAVFCLKKKNTNNETILMTYL